MGGVILAANQRCLERVGGWVGGVEEEQRVGMRCCGFGLGGWVGGWTYPPRSEAPVEKRGRREETGEEERKSSVWVGEREPEERWLERVKQSCFGWVGGWVEGAVVHGWVGAWVR